MASSGTARMISSTSSRRACGLGERARAGDERPEPLAAAGVAAGDGVDRPAGPAQGDAERRPDGARADDPDDGGSPGSACWCGWAWSSGWTSSPWRWWPGGDRIEVDARPASMVGLGLARRSRSGSSPGSVAPGLHRLGRAAAVGRRGTLARIECSEPAEMDALSRIDPFGARAPARPGPPGLLPARRAGRPDRRGTRCPVTVKILLENVLRHAGGGDRRAGRRRDARRLATRASPPRPRSRSCRRGSSSRTSPGVPAIVDLAVMRDAMADLGGDPARVNPLVPADLVIDHSRPGRPVRDAGARSPSTSSASTSATASATSSCAGPRPRSATCASSRPGPASSTRSTSSSWRTVVDDRATGVAFPDTLVGTDSHTTMINGLGVLGYGVGGIEAEAVLLGQPLYQPMPHVVGVRLDGELPQGSTATDLVLVVTEMLRAPRRRRRVRRVRRRRPGRPVARRPGDDQQHEPRVRGDGDALPDRRRDARLPAPDRPVAGAGRRSSSATPRSRACGASPATARLRRAPDARPGDGRAVASPGRGGPRTASRSTALRENFRSNFPDGLEAPVAGESRSTATSSTEASAESFPASDARRSRPPIGRRSTPGRAGRRRCRAGRPTGVPAGRRSRSAARRSTIRTGSVAIAAITSCTNTSNPTVMVGAGLLARNAVARGLRVGPTVKTSLAPGSKAVTGYLEAAGLMAPLETLGFALAGYGCTTCIGNSGPLDAPVAEAIEAERPRRRGRPVGQPQLRGPDPSARARELPRLAAARRRVRPGRPGRHRPHDRAARHRRRRRAGLPRRHLAVARRDPLGHRRRRSTRSCSGGPTPSSSRATSAGGRCRSRRRSLRLGSAPRRTSPSRRSSTA